MKTHKRYKIWLKQANFDLEASKLSYDSGFYEWSTYQAEQAVEKALKSVLVHAGQQAPRLHKLAVLFGYSNSVNQKFKNTKFKFKHIESFTFISRYPFLVPGQYSTPHEFITKNDAFMAIEEARDILDKIENILKTPIDVEINFQDKSFVISREELDKRLNEVKLKLVKEFNPQKIILFGSYAREKLPDYPTTLDLVIIADTNLPFFERIRKARIITRGGYPAIEPLVYTPSEYKRLSRIEKEPFFSLISKEGRIIYSVD